MAFFVSNSDISTSITSSSSDDLLAKSMGSSWGLDMSSVLNVSALMSVAKIPEN